jgi:hypothetical protein
MEEAKEEKKKLMRDTVAMQSLLEWEGGRALPTLDHKSRKG